MNLLKEMADHLAFCGFGAVDRDIFWGRMPDSPDRCIGVFSMDSAWKGARVQVLIRAAETVEAYETACAVAEAVDGFHGFLGGCGAMASISVDQAAEGLGADGKKRELYACALTVRWCAARD